ncbi:MULTISPECIES: NAD(P)/FAD-dependent oxidoreductase [Giesbergeria]|uniref:NAD(P)/FAD-dependent oxidoreductase n=1 Tax=Giesbergeria sinuosa TaxID=80883 RepID=A0ABV9QH27_9BURK
MPRRTPATSSVRSSRLHSSHSPQSPRHFAVVGAGVAGIACARTLLQAGHQVTVFEKSNQVGGRTATHDSPFGSFDAGAQYFTIRDERFALALDTAPNVFRPWSANAIRVLDATGHVASASQPPGEAHWVATPGMSALADAWAEPLRQGGHLHTNAHVVAIERDPVKPQHWQVRAQSPDGAQQVVAGFDAVLLAQPADPARSLLTQSGIQTPLVAEIAGVITAPCWTMMLAFPQSVRPGLTTLGPQWNAARSTHHRIAWLARESSKPQRGIVERWTVQASPAWSHEHLNDDSSRVQAKLLKAFAEVTGIHAQPGYVEMRRWRHAQTTQPLGRSHLLDSHMGIGACGDWCLGHRLEDAFLSGLELALAVDFSVNFQQQIATGMLESMKAIPPGA